MAKRFTDSEKWNDKWYRTLSPAHKHAWNYMCDCCDHAGVYERDDDLAEFRIGEPVDWDEFLKLCEDRVHVLHDGKIFLTKFIEFQYGELSENCRGHNPVFASIRKHNLKGYLIGYSKGSDRGQDKDKDKDKDKKKNKDVPVADDWVLPDGWDRPDVREALAGFAEMRKRKKKPIKSLRSTSKVFKHFDDPEHLIFAAEFCEANEYQGLKPDYRLETHGCRNGKSKTFAQQRVSNSQQAIKDFCNVDD